MGKDKYPTVLQRLLGSDEYEVRNLGIGMRTMLSKGDYPYIKEAKYREALAWNPDIVVIKLGTNDAKDYNWVHKDEYEQNYIDFVKAFKDLPANPKIYVCYPLPVFPNNWIPIDSKTFTDEMFPMIDRVAAATGATVIDLYTPFLGKDFLTFDQVHPNYRGASYMAHLIAAAVCPEGNIPEAPEELYIRIAPDDMTKHCQDISTSFSESIGSLIDGDITTGADLLSSGEDWIVFEMPVEYTLTAYSILSGKQHPNTLI